MWKSRAATSVAAVVTINQAAAGKPALTTLSARTDRQQQEVLDLCASSTIKSTAAVEPELT